MKKTESCRVKWDEDTIAEHDKDRGTRMVIDEPDTPFVRSPPGEGESASSSCSLQAASGTIRHDKTTFCLPQVEENEIDKSPQGGLESDDNASFTGISNSKGNAGVKRSNQGGASASNSSPTLRESDVGLRLEKWLQNPSIEEADATSKEDKFAKMRKQHYNEFELIKRMKAEGMNMDDEDDDEDDSEAKAGEKSNRDNNNDGTEKEGTDENTQRNKEGIKSLEGDGNTNENDNRNTNEEGDAEKI